MVTKIRWDKRKIKPFADRRMDLEAKLALSSTWVLRIPFLQPCSHICAATWIAPNGVGEADYYGSRHYFLLVLVISSYSTFKPSRSHCYLRDDRWEGFKAALSYGGGTRSQYSWENKHHLRSGEAGIWHSAWSFLPDSSCIRGKRVERTQCDPDIAALLIRQIKLFWSENWAGWVWKPVGKSRWSPSLTFVKALFRKCLCFSTQMSLFHLMR